MLFSYPFNGCFFFFILPLWDFAFAKQIYFTKLHDDKVIRLNSNDPIRIGRAFKTFGGEEEEFDDIEPLNLLFALNDEEKNVGKHFQSAT